CWFTLRLSFSLSFLIFPTIPKTEVLGFLGTRFIRKLSLDESAVNSRLQKLMLTVNSTGKPRTLILGRIVVF
ncbi:MAG: hypothetical protein ACP5IT_12275, partial [Thermoproteota archaeon]